MTTYRILVCPFLYGRDLSKKGKEAFSAVGGEMKNELTRESR